MGLKVKDEWCIGVNVDGELVITRNDEAVVAFTADYTMELYMALSAYFQQRGVTEQKKSS